VLSLNASNTQWLSLKAAQAFSAAPDFSAQTDGTAPCSRTSCGAYGLPPELSTPESARRRLAMLAGCQRQGWNFMA